ncbi:MAG TPA: DNA-processing protein DprA [Candidatus Binatia bacterium]|jgi:DNA processing protein|nr:DNA-processing protein DprA [Candidatus Binatia bacterium]
MENRRIKTEERAAWRYWLALRLVRGVGNVTYRELLERFGTPQAVLAASPADLGAAGAHAEVARAIASFDQWPTVETELNKIVRAGVRLVTRTDPEYPVNLTHLHDPPPFLYLRGSFVPEDRIAIAVVGSRFASSYGKGAARDLARGLAEKGVTIVSGLARGIDAEAHRAALAAGGRTIAVLGSGLDIIYPSEHRALAAEIPAHGAVVSEFSLGSKPDAVHFPYRNRVISGLTLGTVVVEAAENSGSLITARCALEQNREVFAVPGPITTSRSRGPHRLIKDGAKLVEGIDDILHEIAPALAPPRPTLPVTPTATLEPHEALLVGLFDGEPQHVDALIARSGLSAARVLEVLLGMELKGVVIQLPGTHFTLTGEWTSKQRS